MHTDISGWKTRLSDDMIERYKQNGGWIDKTLADCAIERAVSHADKVAVEDGRHGWTFPELLSSARRLASSLARMGLKPGDVISFQLPNWAETTVINLAACLGGYICNPIVPIYRDAEVRFILKDAHAKVLFIPDVFRNFNYPDMVRRIRPQLPGLQKVVTVRGSADDAVTFDALLADGPDAGATPTAVVDPNAVKLLLYTSGTTANPKGVLHSHNTIMAEINAVMRYWQISAQDVILMPSPVTHITGYLYALELAFAAGAKVILMEQWNARDAISLIQAHGASMTVGATPFLFELVAEVERQRTTLSSMRLFASGGAPVPPEVIRRASEALPSCSVTRVYGSSEAPTVTLGVTAPEERMLGATTDGRIVNHDVLIVDPTSGVVSTEGTEGEIVTRGPEVMLGYTDWAETENSFDADDYFHTGDLGLLSHGEFITITGRLKDLIIRGGENISARDVEDVLHQHPAIRDVAVVAMPHARLGETPCAFVELVVGKTLELAEVIIFLEQSRIAKQKFPERVEIVDALPRTASGKILKHVLRSRAKDFVPADRRPK